MKNGTCPKCNSSNVFKKIKGVLVGNGVITVNSGFSIMGSEFESYLCVDCGYFENYIMDKAKLQEVQQKWAKVT